MKQAISEDKKEILMGHIKELEDELCDFLHHIEIDESIPDAAWDAIQETAGNLFSKLNKLREEILFT